MTSEDIEVVVHEERIACEDGLPIAMSVYRPAEASEPLPVTVFCHGFKGFRMWGMFPQLARRLATTGRGCVLFDFSHNGVGDEPEEFTRLDLFREQTVTRHVADLGSVLDALENDGLADACNLDPTLVFAVGHSMGGGVALMRASFDRRVAGLACLNAVSHYRRVSEADMKELEATGQVSIPNARTGQIMPLGQAWFDDVERINLEAIADEVAVPTLVLQGEEDSNVLPAEGEALSEWIPGAVFFTVPGGDHTFGARHPWGGWTDPLEVVVEQLDAFLPANDV